MIYPSIWDACENLYRIATSKPDDVVTERELKNSRDDEPELIGLRN